jgi:hypothetical protein
LAGGLGESGTIYTWRLLVTVHYFKLRGTIGPGMEQNNDENEIKMYYIVTQIDLLSLRLDVVMYGKV